MVFVVINAPECFAFFEAKRNYIIKAVRALSIWNGKVLATGQNSQLTENQVLAHAEMVLLHAAVTQYDAEILRGATMYTSAEPCAMCSGAIFWSGIGRLVFGVSGETLHELMDLTPDMLVTSSRDVLAGAGRKVEVVGPLLEEEAKRLFEYSPE